MTALGRRTKGSLGIERPDQLVRCRSNRYKRADMPIPRRSFLRGLMAPVAAGLLRRMDGASFGVELAKEFPASTVQAISPDGTKLCVEDWMERGYPIRVLETGTWRVIYSGRFETRTHVAGFLKDGQSFMCEGPTPWRAIVDLRTGERALKYPPYNPHEHQGDTFTPAGDRTLLMTHWQSPPYQTTTLSLVDLPDYREIVKVPYATETRKPRPVKGGVPLDTECGPVLSDGRKILACSFDNILACRRIEDLAVLWTKSVEPDLELLRIAISADGARIAASVGEPSVEEPTRAFRQHYLGVYDGGTGEELARLQIYGTEWMALSADGKLIAVVSHERGEKGAVLPSASIYEISSGRKVASVVHGPVKRGRHQWLESGITVAFTSDGKYLITSGMATRVWSLGEGIEHA